MAMKPRSRRGRSSIPRTWATPGPSTPGDPRRLRPRSPVPQSPVERRSRTTPGRGLEPQAEDPGFESILDDFTRSWERGEHPRAEVYLGTLSFEQSAELIYHEYCLAESSDLDPVPAEFLRRFPRHEEALTRLFSLHGVFSASTLQAWVTPAELPSSGDEIGPYRLLRELGRGAFARVFLAEQADLDDRLVVLKVSTRATSEPQLLARVSHVHIVEVLRHVTADDGALHLVCMPFLGGATLASVLDERRGHRRPRSGRELLGDLDRVSAPEYPSTEKARPTRELLSILSHGQALAWIVARLAEALDHAHQRGVAHGDLKPSNVLLTADANPLLLDFNLSVDWRDVGPEDAAELGGTLAYMAPERLDAIASGVLDRNRKAADLHRADLYSLGLLLLEALTGKAPTSPARRAGSPRELAGELAGLRRDLPASIGWKEFRSIPLALRSILARCLATDPLDRYARGKELAEDLDRWRSDRPLAYAQEPRTSALLRTGRRARTPLIGFGLTLVVALIVSGCASIILEGSQRDQALDKYAMITDRADSGVFVIRNQYQWRANDLGDPLEVASRQLARYDILKDPDWRSRVDIRSLPDRERGELEVWLFGQILRYATALGEAPDSPDSWKRGLALLDRTLEKVSSEPLQACRLALLEKLDQAGRPRPVGPKVERLPHWMEVYLAGIAAEPIQARDALGYFLEALRDRPDLFWAHHQAAVTFFRLGEYDKATRHLRVCSERYPDNVILHVQLASTLRHAARDMAGEFKHDPLGEALLESDRAMRIDPDFAPLYPIRAQILKLIGQEESVEANVERYTTLSRVANPEGVISLRMDLMIPPFYNFFRTRQASLNYLKKAQQFLQMEPNDLEMRTRLAVALALAGWTHLAIAEYDRVLEADPGLMKARFDRATQYAKLKDPRAIEEFRRLIENPRIEELFKENPATIRAFHYVATDLMDRDQLDEALEIARRSLLHVQRSRSLSNECVESRMKVTDEKWTAPRAETEYVLARIHHEKSRSAATPPDQRKEHFKQCIESLNQAIQDPQILKKFLEYDRRFDPSRSAIMPLLKKFSINH